LFAEVADTFLRVDPCIGTFAGSDTSDGVDGIKAVCPVAGEMLESEFSSLYPQLSPTLGTPCLVRTAIEECCFMHNV
jgi:hypothetical protein